tara:strand:- start:1318 stop:2373 length:1056 start_codon:yes stop_codon:yes gene_type:complete
MYVFLFVFALLIYALSTQNKNPSLFYLLSAFLIIICGFRGINVGRDTLEYHQIFENIVKGNPVAVKEYGYILLVKVIAYIGGTQQLIFLIISIITMWGFSRFILLYSSDIYLSLLIFIFIGPFYLGAFNQMRQYLAISIFLGYCVPLIQQRKFLYFTLITIIAALFAHLSIIILFPLYFLLNRKITLFYKIIILFGFNTALGFLTFIILNSPYGYFLARQKEVSIELTLIAVQIVISLFFLILEKNITYGVKNHGIFFNMAFFSTLMLLTAVFYPTLPGEVFLRVNNYLFPFMIILVPDFLKIFDLKKKVLATAGMICFISLYYVRTAILLGKSYDLSPYSFNFAIFKFLE